MLADGSGSFSWPGLQDAKLQTRPRKCPRKCPPCGRGSPVLFSSVLFLVQLSDPLKQLNAVLYLLHRYASPSAIGSVILSGIVSCDAAATRIRIRIVRYQQPAKRQKHKPCQTQGRFLPPLLLVGSKALGRNEGNFTLRFVWQFDVAIRVPKEHWERENIAAETFAMRNR